MVQVGVESFEKPGALLLACLDMPHLGQQLDGVLHPHPVSHGAAPPPGHGKSFSCRINHQIYIFDKLLSLDQLNPGIHRIINTYPNSGPQHSPQRGQPLSQLSSTPAATAQLSQKEQSASQPEPW